MFNNLNEEDSMNRFLTGLAKEKETMLSPHLKRGLSDKLEVRGRGSKRSTQGGRNSTRRSKTTRVAKTN
jgi:hypothetical protein